MCEQRVALEMIEAQQDKGGLTPAMYLLHKMQCEDFEKQQESLNKMDIRMTKIEKDMAEVKAVQAEMKATQEDTLKKVDTILEMLKSSEVKPTAFERFLDKVVDKKYYWFWLILLTGALAGLNFEHIAELWKH